MIAVAGWEHFSHVADVGLHGWGPTLASAFAQAAKALTAIVTTEPISESSSLEIECTAPDRELLLVEWLNSLIYEMATRRMLFGRFDVSCNDVALQARVFGETVDVARHQPVVEVKGATLTELAVEWSEDGCWHARCVVDV